MVCDSKKLARGRKEEVKRRLLFELIRCSRRSDKELSKVIGCTRATVYRRRKELEKEGLIREYTVIPDLAKMGYEICAFIFLSWREHPNEDELAIGREWLASVPNILFCSAGEGLATNIVVSLHKNFADFSSFIDFLRRSSQPKLDNLQFFIVPLTRTDSIYKNFSFRTLTHEKSGTQAYSGVGVKKNEACICYKEHTIFTLKNMKYEMDKFERITNNNFRESILRHVASSLPSRRC
ncbi:MAG: Lrp/AsnC family transcriptional regulator [Candidatus Jordarchaeales archaeon]